MTPSPHELTQLLVAWRNGDPDALNRLMPLVYGELRRLARRYTNKFAGESLDTTALVHEAYLRLAGQDKVVWQNRAHFYALCAQLMRNLLVDRARSRATAKHGGDQRQVSLDESTVGAPREEIGVLALNEALDRLGALDPRKSRIVEMRYFGGMTVEETAEALAISPVTVKREWSRARAWLYRELKMTGHAPAGGDDPV